MSVLLIAGSPSERSRSAALLDALGERLRQRGVYVERLQIRELSPQALLLADTAHHTIVRAADQVARASTIIICTPVYKAAYSGVLKVFLDLLPQTAFKDKIVLPLATAGSPHHMLALDYALRPVLQSLSARVVLPSIFATDGQITLTPEGGHFLSPEIGERLDVAVQQLFDDGLRASKPSSRAPLRVVGQDFESVPFSQVRCSV